MFLIAAGLLVSCKQKEQECSATKYKIPGGVAFKGFQVAELQPFFLNTYTSGSNFVQPLSSDTLYYTDIQIRGGMAYRSLDSTTPVTPFFEINTSRDYEVILPVVNRTFRISKVSYGADVVRWTSIRCDDPGRTFIAAPESAEVNGAVTYTISTGSGPQRCLLLSR